MTMLVKYDPRLLLSRVAEEVSRSWSFEQAQVRQEEMLVLTNELLADQDLEKLLKEKDFFQGTLEELAQIINLGLTTASGNSFDAACRIFSEKDTRYLYEVGRNEILKRVKKAKWLKGRQISVKNRTGEMSISVNFEMGILYENQMKVLNRVALGEISEIAGQSTNLSEKIVAADGVLKEVALLFEVLSKLPWQKIHRFLPMSAVNKVSQLLLSLAVDLELYGDFTKDILRLERKEIETFVDRIGQFDGQFSFSDFLTSRISFKAFSEEKGKLTETLTEKLATSESEREIVGLAVRVAFEYLNAVLIYPEKNSSHTIDGLNEFLHCFFVEFVTEQWSDVISFEENVEKTDFSEQLHGMTYHQLSQFFDSRPRERLEIIQSLAETGDKKLLFQLLTEWSYIPGFHKKISGWMDHLDFSFVLEFLVFWESQFKDEKKVFMDGLVHDAQLAKIIKVMKKPKRQKVLEYLRSNIA